MPGSTCGSWPWGLLRPRWLRAFLYTPARVGFFAALRFGVAAFALGRRGGLRLRSCGATFRAVDRGFDLGATFVVGRVTPARALRGRRPTGACRRAASPARAHQGAREASRRRGAGRSTRGPPGWILLRVVRAGKSPTDRRANSSHRGVEVLRGHPSSARHPGEPARSCGPFGVVAARARGHEVRGGVDHRRGRVGGEVHARDHVVDHPTGRVTATVMYAQLGTLVAETPTATAPFRHLRRWAGEVSRDPGLRHRVRPVRPQARAGDKASA